MWYTVVMLGEGNRVENGTPMIAYDGSEMGDRAAKKAAKQWAKEQYRGAPSVRGIHLRIVESPAPLQGSYGEDGLDATTHSDDDVRSGEVHETTINIDGATIHAIETENHDGRPLFVAPSLSTDKIPSLVFFMDGDCQLTAPVDAILAAVEIGGNATKYS